MAILEIFVQTKGSDYWLAPVVSSKVQEMAELISWTQKQNCNILRFLSWARNKSKGYFLHFRYR